MKYSITIRDDANNQFANKHINEEGYEIYKDAIVDWEKVVKDVKNNLDDFADFNEIEISLNEHNEDGDIIPISNPNSEFFGEWQIEIIHP